MALSLKFKLKLVVVPFPSEVIVIPSEFWRFALCLKLSAEPFALLSAYAKCGDFILTILLTVKFICEF